MQTIRDKADFIALYGKAVAVVLGNSAHSDFELVDVNSVPLPDDIAANLHARGLGYVGTLGLVGGKFRSGFAVPLDAATLSALSQAYLEFCVVKFSASKDDAVPTAATDWLKKLWELPDTRGN